jgi:hypothetical protein
MQLHPKFVAAAAFATLFSACTMMQAPAELDVRLAKPSAAGRYQVSLRPLIANPAINQMHAWEIAIVNSAGQPVSDARIGVSGGMPAHHHGFPTTPRVTATLGGGRYVLDGVKFSMTGWWQFKLQLDAAGGSDEVVFNTVVTEPAPGPVLASSK